MTPAVAPAQAVYERAAAEIAGHLDADRDVAVLCQGDPFFYGSFIQIFARLAARYPTLVVPGVSSLAACAAAAGLRCGARRRADGDPAPLAEKELEARLAQAEAAAVIKLGAISPGASRADAPRPRRGHDLRRAREPREPARAAVSRSTRQRCPTSPCSWCAGRIRRRRERSTARGGALVVLGRARCRWRGV